ncbi:hypothetical protein IJG44_01610 [bacterium]|nr:hypothetical protein [bacterium]
MKRFLNLSVVLLVFLLFSCSSSKSQNDSDMISDSDEDTQDSETQDDDSGSQDFEIIDDSDETPDADADQDRDMFDEEWQRDIDIPEMSDDPYFEAYGDADFNVAYYYYGDEPTPSQDPENVKALWSKRCKNDSCTECTPKPYDLCAENYPFEPQIIGGSGSGKKKSTAGQFQCDALLTPGAWATSDLFNSMVFDEFNGKVLFLMHGYGISWIGDGTYVYDLNTRKVERYGRARMDGWQNKRYYFISTYDYRIDIDNENSPYFGKMNRHLLYYDKETNTYGRAFKMPENTTNIVDVRANENYIFMSAKFSEDGSDMRILYTRIGEWDKWKELTYKKETLYGNDRRAGYPSMFENLVTYFDYDIQVQVCDLDVGDSSCFQVSRADEYGRYPIFKDKNTVVYAAQDIKTSKDSIVVADISEPKNIKYSTIYEAGDMLGIGGDDLEENYLLIKRRYTNPTDSSKELNDHCIYRFYDKKLFCFDEDFDLEMEKNESFIYKNFYIFRSVQNLVVRDLECYCDFYPNKCPLIDYTPNPESPKKPWGFEWKPENLRKINSRNKGEKR